MTAEDIQTAHIAKLNCLPPTDRVVLGVSSLKVHNLGTVLHVVNLAGPVRTHQFLSNHVLVNWPGSCLIFREVLWCVL